VRFVLVAQSVAGNGVEGSGIETLSESVSGENGREIVIERVVGIDPYHDSPFDKHKPPELDLERNFEAHLVEPYLDILTNHDDRVFAQMTILVFEFG
jgi:hypothetical protein